MIRQFVAATVTSLALAVGLFTVASALAVPPAPTLDRPVIDQTGTLTEQQISQLSSQISQGRTGKSYQLAILIIPTLDGDAIEDYSIRVARTWGIGEKDKNNGILLLVAMNDRKMRIEVGRGVEDDLTDLESGRIIRNIMRPAFRNNDYFGGISGAVTEIQNNMQGVPTDASQVDTTGAAQKVSSNSFIDTIMFAAFFIVPLFSWFLSMLARTKSWWAGGVAGGVIGVIIMALAGFAFLSVVGFFVLAALGFLLDFIVSHNYHATTRRGDNPSWWAGGPWLGGGGGGGWSGGSGGGFGGGDFGGGGSSGSW